jgi:DNA-binding beta-propeller fold protein YncE
VPWRDVAISANGKIICVLTTSLKGAYLTRINARTGVAAPPIAVPALSQSVAITPGGRAAYVVVQAAEAMPHHLPKPGSVLPVNLVTGAVGRGISVALPGQLVISPDGHMAYVSSNRPLPNGSARPQVVAINLATNTARRPIAIPGYGSADGIAVSPGGKTVYIITSRPFHAKVTPISAASGTVMKPIPIQPPSSSDVQLAIAPDGSTAYVYSRNVQPISLRTGTALRAIRLPRGSGFAFQIAPDGRIGFVYGQGAEVIPIDLATNTAKDPLVVAPPPYNEISTYSSPLGIYSGYLYAGIADSSWTPSARHPVQGALSEVQLSTGQVRIIKLSGLPEELLIAP